MRNKGIRVVADYIEQYADELSRLRFEPEKEFETLIDYEDGDGSALISGAIDLIRQDDPPRATLIDFKSGDPESDNHQKLDEEEMRLQVAIYGVAAKKELQYLPDQGLVRYLDASDAEKRELQVPLDETAIGEAKSLVATTAAQIRDRGFRAGPKARDGRALRCPNCDFVGLCGTPEATAYKRSHPGRW